jgi:hypothetical protein
MIEFACPSCGKVLRADDAHVGKRAKCTGCGASVTVPAIPPVARPSIRALVAAATGRDPIPSGVVADDPGPANGVPLPPPVAAAVPAARSVEDEPVPWYYLAIEVVAMILITLGCVQFAIFAFAAATYVPLAESATAGTPPVIARPGEWMLTSGGVLVGSIVTAASMMLMVDLARNVRRMRIRAERD